jgi:hypothetical protein
MTPVGTPRRSAVRTPPTTKAATDRGQTMRAPLEVVITRSS